MTPIQQLLLGTGAVNKKPYIENVFNIDLYKGTAAAKTITNGINLGSGGLVITKNRDSSANWAWGSPIAAMGTGKYLQSNAIYSATTDSNAYTAFNNNGYTIGSTSILNANNDDFVGYSFKKTPGLVDVISYVGDGTSSRVLSHDLGSVPGWIAITCTTKGENKTTWHRSFGDRVSGSTSEYYAFLDSSVSARNNNNPYPALPTATQLTIGSYVNITGETYVAYIFGGGESPASEARSVVFDNDADRINIGDASNKSSDLNFGSSDFTWECWIKADATQGSYGRIIHNNTSNQAWGSNAAMIIWDHSSQPNRMSFFAYNLNSSGSNPTVKSAVKGWNGDGQWHHVAVTRSGNIFRIFSDGVLEDTVTSTGSLDNGDAYMGIGQRPDSTSTDESFKGSISNVRIVKGTAVYTSSFKPSTVPLTNITNTKLLCCNNSSVTGSTVTPLTIFSNGSPTASTDSSFLDPAGFVFGENENEPIIATGSYQGTGIASGANQPEIYLGFEPQLLLFKNATSAYSWKMFDSMRGIISYGNDVAFTLNEPGAESNSTDFVELTPTGFKISGTNGAVNLDNNKIAYIAIRRPDLSVGTPREATELFAMARGNGSTTVPAFTSGFPVDMRIGKKYGGTHAWYLGTRFMYQKHVRTNLADAETAGSWLKMDYNLGEGQSWDSSYQGYMWRRGQGFDCLGYTGNGVAGRQILHNLSKIPEMIIIKTRSQSSQNWMVGHKGLGGGINPWEKYANLNTDGGENDFPVWNDLAPTATYFNLGTVLPQTNNSNQAYVALLFTSVSGISSVGSYTGDGSTDGSHEITLGFTPRFLMIKCVTSGVSFRQWNVWDSLRGLDGSGSECYLKLNTDGPEVCSYDYLDTTATGFKLNSNYGPVNGSGNRMIYYAHA
tara:strand:+ start:293 stop:2968 length:2676 start_codon:yes stop_codon:yes gene_type:complete